MTPGFLIVSPLLRILTSDHDIDGWDDVAWQWLFIIAVLSVVSAIMLTGGKWVWKSFGRGIMRQITWSHKLAWGVIGLGFLLNAGLCVLCWSFGRDLRMIVGYRGLLVGIGLSGVVHLGLVAASHRLFNWLRELL